MTRDNSYRIASELDQPPVVTDTEFFAFVVGEQRNLGFWRRTVVSLVLRREPWLTMLRQEREEVAKSEFLHPDPAKSKAEFEALWEEHLRELSEAI